MGSTLALILGIFTFVAGVTQQQGDLLIAGPVIIVGTLAYRSAKKRNLGEAKNSILRKGLEGIAIVAILAAVLLQNDLKRQIATDPVPNLIIPLWAIIAYAVVVLRKASQAMNKHG